jgi:membrane protease YdiL (CAAX protease family)
MQDNNVFNEDTLFVYDNLHKNKINNTDTIDVHNPFDNDTENIDYNSDYSGVYSDILNSPIIPITPFSEEKKSIKKSFNSVGAFLLIHFFSSSILYYFLLLFAFFILVFINPTQFGDLDLIINSNTFDIAANLISFLIINILITAIGCTYTKISFDSLFENKELKLSVTFKYIALGMFFYAISNVTISLISYLLTRVNLEPTSPDFSVSENPRLLILSLLYTCIIAPITEEFLFRGFVLKNLSKVSQRFGIISSAILFGLMHANLYQFILAFILGIFLANVAIKQNSIIIPILIHFVINTSSMLFSILDEINKDFSDRFFILMNLIAIFIGIIILIFNRGKDKLPKINEFQKNRTFKIAVTSIPLIIIFTIYIVSVVFSIFGNVI